MVQSSHLFLTPPNANFIIELPNAIIAFANAIIESTFSQFIYYGELCTEFISTSRMAKTNIDKKGIAKSLYLDGTYTQEEIAEKVGVSRQTVCRWLKDGHWDSLKASLTITPAQIISQLNRQIVEINNVIGSREEGQRFATVSEADTLAKLATAIKKIETDLGITDIISVAMRFLSWLRPLDLEKAKQFNDLFDAFIKDQTSKMKK